VTVAANGGGQGHGGGAYGQNLYNSKTLAHAREGGREIEPAMADEWQGDGRQTLAQPRWALNRARRMKQQREKKKQNRAATTQTRNPKPLLDPFSPFTGPLA